MNKTINDIVREVVEGECGCEPRVFACSENHAKLMAEGEGERAKEFEIDLDFHASFTIKAKNKEEATELAMEKARLEYGSEVADFGDFTYTPNDWIK